jgi:23S rRNA (guanine745-N1)-methyltransferase
VATPVPDRAEATGIGRALPYLRCPVCTCGTSLFDGPGAGSSVACPVGHTFDIARQGYLSLLTAGDSTSTGDSTAMVEAREAFLARGFYDRIARAVSEAIPAGGISAGADEPAAIRANADELCVDLGGGTGFYLTRVLADHPRLVGITLDLSAVASRRAARAHPRASAIRANVWSPIPIMDGTASHVLSIFSPRNMPEVRRILAPGGSFVMVTPTPQHLVELVERLDLVSVDDRKQERLDAQLAGFERLSHSRQHYEVQLDRTDILAAILMGPSARHVDPAELAERVETIPEPFGVTVSVDVAAYSPSAMTEAEGRMGE